MPMQGRRYWLWELLIFTAMVALECAVVGLTTIYKAAITKGLNYHVYMAYTYAIAAAFLLPLACLSHRNTPLPPLTVVLLGKFFILGFLGFTEQYLKYLGMAYSSPTLGSAMGNINLACTFCLAILFRMEKLKLRSLSSQAKIIGASMSIAGALVIVLYNGPMLIPAHDKDLRISITDRVMSGAQYDWILGGTLLAAGNVVSSIWYIFQTIFVKEYPAEFILVFFFSFFGFSLALPVGIAFEPHLSSWIIPPDIRLVSVLYSGIVGTGIGYVINAWGLHVKGPVYVSLFKPLAIPIATVAGVIFLGDQLYLGCVMGSIIIAVGFYTLMWGKLKEEMVEELSPPSDHHSAADSSDGLDDIVAPLIKR
ncbi:WAT1-related protein At5g40240-like isoform X4 [Andrographis paniculata]|uniref:WAT1-related protein At5g40240-like isoform X3 n=1 Tax=Andrographis paniculata TaxID=175694 RepID=UPI0021E79567|nr:WAT1-related protein At5g40240-like isoform X3 [Andrographis paniculata]XP_051140960.1 WAT1-related protein At5g40240-like isoform X4 [Andrographis paniculata]